MTFRTKEITDVAYEICESERIRAKLHRDNNIYTLAVLRGKH